MRSPLTVAGPLAGLILAIAGQAQAHAHLTGSEPAADATVAAPKQLVLHFSEKLQPKFSGFDLIPATGGKVAMKASVDKDGKTLTGALARPLAPGVYKVDWHAVTADTHRMEGAYSFTVR